MSFNSVFRTTRQVVACSRRVKAPPRSPTARLAVGSAQRPKPERVDHRRKIDVASSISASDINADDEPPEEAPSAATGRTTTAWWQAGLAAAAFAAIFVSNRLLYRLALVPMADHLFFLAQLQTFGYVLVYGSILMLRIRSGAVTPAMLATPKSPFLLVGLFEALSQLLAMAAASCLPGVLLPVLGQTFLAWNLLLGRLIFGAKFARAQVVGAVLALLGAMAAAAPSQLTSAAASSASSSSLSSASGQLAAPRHVALFLASQALAALAVLLKERIFKQAHVRLGRSLDLFVVNTGASAAQAAFVLLLLPLYASTRGVPLSRVPDALLQGVQCFAGLAPSCGSDCSGAPLLPASYLAVNIALNICALFLLRSLGSLAASLSTAVMVPLTIAAFALLPLPYLSRPELGPYFYIGSGLLVLGLLVYNLEGLQAALQPGTSRRDPPAAARHPTNPTAVDGGGSGGAQGRNAPNDPKKQE